jgi:thioredoxin-related protein
MNPNLKAARVARWFIFLITALLLAQAGFANEKKGQFLGAKETEYPDWFKESFLELEDDVQEAGDAGRRVVLFFHQDGCPYCNLMVEHNLAQKDIYETVREHFDVIALNLWGDREVATVDGKTFTEKGFAAALRVQFTPTLVFLDEQGRSVLRVDGYYPPEHFRVALDYVAGREEQTSSFRDYYASVVPKPASGELNQQSFFSSPPHVLTRDDTTSSPPLAVFFEQSQCPNCDTLHRKTLGDPPTRTLIEQFESVQLDMWSDTPLITPANTRTTAKDWARDLGVTYAPTIVFFDREGKEIIRTDSYFNTFHTQSTMDYVLSGAYRDEPSFQRYISARADATRERGIDVDLLR